MRVLIVEDDIKLAALIRRGLGAQGIASDVVHGSDDAFVRSEATSYDVIVLDVMLPGRDGSEICRELREQRNWAGVLMLTARDGVTDRVAGLNAGAVRSSPAAHRSWTGAVGARPRMSPRLWPPTCGCPGSRFGMRATSA